MNMEFTGDYSHENLVRKAMMNAKPQACGPAARWVAVRDTFATGSTMATDMCRAYCLDPFEEVSGARCIACNP